MERIQRERSLPKAVVCVCVCVCECVNRVSHKELTEGFIPSQLRRKRRREEKDEEGEEENGRPRRH